VTVGAAGGYCAVVVCDTGAGIPPEVLPYVFERFYRGAPAEGREPGAGLGLAIARWVAEAHGGTIAIESELGRGSTVTIRLPAAVSSS
jgi:signal transduction histidine kinase